MTRCRDQHMRLTAMVGLVVEDVNKHLGERLFEPIAIHIGVFEGCGSRMAVMSAAWFVEFRQRLPWLLHVD